MMKPKLLIVDDDEDIRSQMKWALLGDYDVLLADDRHSALNTFSAQNPLVVLLDLGLPPSPSDPTEGLAALSSLLAMDHRAKVIIVSGQGEKSNALHAVGDGAYDFLCKPVDIDELRIILKRAFQVADLEREYSQMQQRISDDEFEGMLGASRPMMQVFNTIRKVATTDAAVLILGESGTGKEMAAQAIHNQSARKHGPFVAINCGAIPDNLLEAELFGHEKGSFTGAHEQKKGRIQNADGGTLFLDEIGELPLPLQVKILRFLQEQTIERVGGRETIHTDSRIISATNVDLIQSTKKGLFREDLYYRLAVVTLSLPPLRDRGNDCLLMAQAFLQKYAAQNNKPGLKFNQDALKALHHYAWPGNVREMENRVKRAVIMAKGTRVAPGDLELTGSVEKVPRTLKEARETIELELVQQALERNKGKISQAAVDLGVSRPTLYELMDKLGIKRGD